MSTSEKLRVALPQRDLAVSRLTNGVGVLDGQAERDAALALPMALDRA